MKALKVLAFVLIATFCYSAVNAQDMHHRVRRHHHKSMMKHRHWKKRH